MYWSIFGPFLFLRKITKFKELTIFNDKMASYICDKCNKNFRGNYELNRHRLKKFPCVKEKIPNKSPKQKEKQKQKTNQDSSGCNVTIINNNVNNVNQVVNNYFTINGDISHIDIEKIIEELRDINKTTNDEYIRAGKMVVRFNVMVMENDNNANMKLSNIQSNIVQVLTVDGERYQSTNEVIDNVVRARAGQLVDLKDSISEKNKKVFQVIPNKKTWNHLEKFHQSGLSHRPIMVESGNRISSVISDIKNGIKISLLK